MMGWWVVLGTAVLLGMVLGRAACRAAYRKGHAAGYAEGLQIDVTEDTMVRLAELSPRLRGVSIMATKWSEWDMETGAHDKEAVVRELVEVAHTVRQQVDNARKRLGVTAL